MYPLTNFKNMIDNGGYDIVWNVEKIKSIILKKEDYNKLCIQRRISKISEKNSHYSKLRTLLKL